MSNAVSLSASQAAVVMNLITRESDRLDLLVRVDPTEVNMNRLLEVNTILDSLVASNVTPSISL